jgi:uracil-DNA glycosylase family 4
VTRQPYVLPGTGWPDDPADAATPVAHDAADVKRLAATDDLGELTARQSVCRACPRLVAWREQVALERRKAFADEPYWGRPIPGWGDADPRVLIVGLAPAAHGGNRTGRVFTGDRSGDWLFASMHRVGLATQPTSTHAGDGQQLVGARLVAAVRCAPPDNKPLPEERDTCRPWFDREVELVADSLSVVVALGAYAWDAVLASASRSAGQARERVRRPRFGHGAEAAVNLAGHPLTVLGSYHPSQQNTFTGRLTAPMLDAVLSRAVELAGQAPGGR